MKIDTTKPADLSPRRSFSAIVSLLTGRARSLTGRDFLGLLKDILPPDALKTLERGK